MEKALLQNLMAGAGSSSQLIGGLIVALLYAVIGLLSAIGSILIVRRIFQGRWEQIFWTSFLVVIVAFYLSFAAYFGASTHAWQTEVVGVAVFLFFAVGGLFARPAIVVGYVMHGLWDLSHCLSGSSLAGLSITEIPLGYGIFCLTYDLTVALYLMISDTAWHESGKFDLYFGDIARDPALMVGTFYGDSKTRPFPYLANRYRSRLSTALSGPNVCSWAQSGHAGANNRCPLSAAKRTSRDIRL